MAVSTLGYADIESERMLQALMVDPHRLLVDIRLMPVSRWRPTWNKTALAAQYGDRYLHLRGLGNVNYKHPEKGIQLLDPDEPLARLRSLLAQGHSLVLLCACKSYATCHRRVVYNLLVPSERG